MSTPAVVDLIRALIEDMGDDAAEDWTSLAMVLKFDSEKVNGVYGFAYSPDGKISAVTASPYRIRSAAKSYTDSYFTPGEPLPLKLLIQFDRTSGDYEVLFEDSDSSRWQVTPDTFDSIHEELRPKFA